MTRRSLFNFAAPAVLAAVLALIVVSCAQQSESPVAPSLVRGGSFNTEVPPPEPTPTPTPTPTGTPCSPGYWKNHLDHFNSVCSAAAALPGDAFTSCSQLMDALTCRGSDESCGRSAAAAALNTISGCTESE